MKIQTDPFVQQKTLLCVLFLFWSCGLAQSTMNTSEVPITIIAIPEPEQNNSTSQGPSADDQLIPFQEECVAHVIHAIRDDGHHTELRCTLPNGLSYRIPSADETWINKQMVLGELISAETIITLPDDAMLNQNTHEIHMTEPPKLWNYELEERERRRKLRRLSTTVGDKTVLVVRIQATDNTTTPSATTLGNHVFGDDGSDYNFKYQAEACSFNQLTINKASDRTGTSARISNGITTVSVNIPATSGEMPVQNAVTVALNTQFSVTAPSDLADHVMYCFPTGTTSQIAYGEVGGYLSFYNNEACTYPSAAMHEIGHNFNMGHSSDSEDEYGDKSGAMGYVYWYTYQPKMCFNAAKSWQLGWYTSKTVSFSPAPSRATYSTRLAGIVDYDTTANNVLLEIQQSNSKTYYYVNYNRMAGINSGTQECKDQVCIVSKDTSVETNLSMALAALSSGQSYTITNFNGQSDETLTITFTSLTSNEANLDIVYTGFTVGPTSTPSVAPSLTPSKSIFPSAVPSSKPSTNPSLSPSRLPSVTPSIPPSLVPSHSPSRIASGAPSISPSLVPSHNPTVSAAPSRSQRPSSQPSASDQPSISFAPSRKPTGVPSVIPSNQPSTLPSFDPSMSPSVISSNQPSTLPSFSSALPSFSPSMVPTISPSVGPSVSTPAPTGRISVQRTATVPVKIGIDGLENLEVLCNGMGSFLQQGIRDVYGPDSVSTVTCERRAGLRNLVGADNIFRDSYEKTVLLTVTTTFGDYRTAPRQNGFGGFLEQLIVSDKAQRELPQYIQNAVGGLVFIDGVHVTLVFSSNQEPMLILGFGEDAPTASPIAGLEIVDDITVNGGGEGSSSGGIKGFRFRQTLMVCTTVGAIMKMLL